MGWLRNYFRRAINRPEVREYPRELYPCPSCKSTRIIKFDRECGRVVSCGRVSCKGCEDYISNAQVSQSLKCLECGHVWTIISSM